jgi:hypothetical protein
MTTAPPYDVKVNGRYGAPMGRPCDLPDATTDKLYLRKVPFFDGDYDNGGAYWGGGVPGSLLYCAWDVEGRATYVRAPNRDVAKKEVLKDAPGAKFFR